MKKMVDLKRHPLQNLFIQNYFPVIFNFISIFSSFSTKSTSWTICIIYSLLTYSNFVYNFSLSIPKRRLLHDRFKSLFSYLQGNYNIRWGIPKVVVRILMEINLIKKASTHKSLLTELISGCWAFKNFTNLVLQQFSYVFSTKKSKWKASWKIK